MTSSNRNIFSQRIEILLLIIILSAELCRTQELGEGRTGENLDNRDGNLITQRTQELWLYRFPPWHSNNPPPRNLGLASEKTSSRLASRIPNESSGFTPFRNQVKTEISDVRDSRSISKRVPDSIGSESITGQVISIQPAPFNQVPFESSFPKISGLSGRSPTTSRDSVSSFSEFSPSISSPVITKLPSNSLQPPGTIISNLIPVPKFDPLPLEDHQPLPQEPSKNSTKDTSNNLPTPEHSSTSEEDPKILFPPTVIFRNQEITSDRLPEFLEENLELQLPVTPRGLNSFGFLSGNVNSVIPKSIQEAIKEHRPFSQPFPAPVPEQPRNRFRKRRRGLLSWIWPSR